MARVSDATVSFIKNHEGLSLDAYPDAGGVWTIGYGHTGPDVYPGQTITQKRADDLLRGDLERFEIGVEAVLKAPATQEEFDAMVSFAFNVGLQAFRDSTLLTHHNAGRHPEASLEFHRWARAGGQVLPGLVKRREKEAAMYRAGGRAG